MKLFISLYFILNFCSYANLKITSKPIFFKEIRAHSNGAFKNKVSGRGIIEIHSDNLEEDLGKLVVFNLPEHTYISNKKRWIKTDKIIFRKEDKEVLIDKENIKVIFYVILDKKEISNEENRELVEGIYKGSLPMNYSIFEKEM
ncbi:hypothetical protein [Cetobacterium sp.]|uniref:hypothetical protein n=1 Tax=Cetobacterium sp. TaxID=2071632 RepID=UPI003EE67C55